MAALSRLFSRPARALLVLLILLNFIYAGLYANQRYLAFETGAFDLGVYAQPLWNFGQGRGFLLTVDVNGGQRWASHVEPILFIVGALYKLWPDPRLLLWLQVAALSLAGLPLFALARRRLQNEWVALIIVLAFFLMPATQAVTLFDFHAVALAPLFLLSAFYFLDRAFSLQGQSLWLWPEAGPHPAAPRSPKRAYLLAGLFFLLALSAKEDISLHVFMIGLYLALLRRRWGLGGMLMAIGLAWFYVAFQIVIPAFRTVGRQSIFVAWFKPLGSTPLEIALSPLTAPEKVLPLIFRFDSLPPLAMITLPLALLPLAGLPFLLMAGPSLAFSLLAQVPTPRHLETWHYAAPMLAFIMLATIDGLARLSYYGSRLARRLAGRRGMPALLPARLTVGLALFLLLVALGYHYLRGYYPWSRLHEWPEITAHHRRGLELAATLPPEASVLAQAQLVPYIAHRADLRIWHGPLETDYDYIWFDLSHPRFPNRFNAHGELLTGLIIEHGFGPVVAEDGYLLLKKGAERVPLPEALFSFSRFEQLPAGAQRFDARFGQEIKLIGLKPEVQRLATSETEPQVILYFETLRQPAQDYHLFLYRLDQRGQVQGATDYAQPSIYWWPTARWQAGERRQVRVNTIPWWTGDRAVFGYALGLSRSDDPWDVSARLPVTVPAQSANPAGSRAIDNGTLLPVAAFQRVAGLPFPRPLTILQIPDPR